MGQSSGGLWGHGFAWKANNDGKLHGSLRGYGALNLAGLPCLLTMVMAEKCEISHPEIDDALGRVLPFFGDFVGRGTIGYGYHRPSLDNNNCGSNGQASNGKNAIAGLIFKYENRISLNEIIEVAEIKGEIKNFHNRSIEIETENGNRIFLPYSMLLNVISSPQKVSETVLNFSFEIRIPTVHHWDKVVDQLRKYIYSLPWSVLKNEPKIHLIEETENKYIIRITLFSFDESYFQLMRKQVELYVSQNF
jgi:hypothetical protein